MNDSALDAPPTPRKKKPGRQRRGRFTLSKNLSSAKKFPERLKEAARESLRFFWEDPATAERMAFAGRPGLDPFARDTLRHLRRLAEHSANALSVFRARRLRR
jgi:hypothetical protein